VVIWYIFTFWYVWTEKNLATLLSHLLTLEFRRAVAACDFALLGVRVLLDALLLPLLPRRQRAAVLDRELDDGPRTHGEHFRVVVLQKSVIKITSKPLVKVEKLEYRKNT
jgi:hypothetical protein